jgi:Gas vesicle synthesis protein GvpL/GvpF
MAMLLYCVAEAARSLGCLPPGVQGLPVSRREHLGLTIFYSEDPSRDRWSAPTVRSSALEFHRVLEAVFNSTAIIPFRFPTIVAGGEELREHLDERANYYLLWLEKFRTSVQLEALVSYSGEDRQAAGLHGGKEYLRRRQQTMAAARGWVEKLEAAVAPLATDWRTAIVDSGIRSFAVVERELVAECKERARKLPPPAGVSVRVTGPWPVTEFLDLNGY